MTLSIKKLLYYFRAAFFMLKCEGITEYKHLRSLYQDAFQTNPSLNRKKYTREQDRQRTGTRKLEKQEIRNGKH